MNLQKSLGVTSTLMTSLSSMLGSGWLFSSFIAAQLAGPAALLAWAVGGLLILFIALCFSEVSTSLPLTGSIAKYGHITHGPIVGFIISWLAWLSCVAVAPTEVQATLMYASVFIKDISYIENGLMLLTTKGHIIAVVLLFIFSFINYFGIRLLAKINNVLATWKIIVPAVTSILLLFTRHDFSQLYTHGGFAPSGLHGVFEAISTVVVFSYLGFREATEFGGEIKNPQTAIPIAVIGSVLFCCFFYILIQLAFLVSIPHDWLNMGWNNIDTHGLAPFANVAMSIGLAYLANLILIDAAITPFSAVLIYTATTARITYAMSENLYLPKVFYKLNAYGIPFNAILLNFFVGCLIFYPLPSWQLLLKFQSTAMIIAYLIGPVSLIVFRKINLKPERPFSVPSFKIMSHLTFLICTIIIYWTGFEAIQLLNYSVLIGIIGYVVFQCIFNEASFLKSFKIKRSIWLIYFLAGIQFIAYMGNYGNGKALLNYGTDYILLALHSMICLNIAVITCNKKQKITTEILRLQEIN